MTRGRGRGIPRPAAAWGFTVLERLVATLRSELGLADEAFDLWGHSAGAQFAHRFALFRPAAPVRRIVAAGAGWYTTPDLELDFPYGLRHEQLGFDRLALERWTRRDIVLLRGEREVRRDEHLPRPGSRGPRPHSLAPCRAHDPTRSRERSRDALAAARCRRCRLRPPHHGPRDAAALGRRRNPIG